MSMYFSEVASLVTPDTILRWHRQLVAQKWTHTRRSSGRPGVMEIISNLVVRMARENRGWGYPRIQGAMCHSPANRSEMPPGRVAYSGMEEVMP